METTPDISPKSLSEEEATWLHLWQTDQSKFMEVVFKRFYVPLGRTVNRMLNDQDATEDIVQEVFIKIWNNRENLQFNFSIKAYLYRSAINSALNYLEKSKKTVTLESDSMPEPSHSDVEETFNLKEVETHIQDALNNLPPACKAIFVLSRYEDMSYREIAESLQLSPKTIENQMGKALKLMRDYLSIYVRNMMVLLF
ncbi:RNA polymerase sigma-70 factor [Cytophagaceae bacterium DM2B3-1]|uniref:RNA polymerase sigma-70 factor n=1 Tax=Xanthocytophaga flava TaxID=3048013 RepID=A0AAE3U7V2_9BACT|nr:RNA polymerase sigma-70 factor [Xanthocytophaga flavus]MDJ1469915.1 RNA polymerase sigma-70 factor [Xanthocytophaga flavus]MDJ1483314.1 RNA polymerase sigma-70 factor [Xanthocytophaga flavus]MDJ1494425.1 RNA polymerase sigma-70 factor [Xanthocytophaga flavus]